jgi:aminopeptidase
MDQRIKNMAKILVKYSTKVRRGDIVRIVGNFLSAPLVESVYIEVLKVGGFPIVDLGLVGTGKAHYDYASDEFLSWTNPFTLDLYKKIDVSINIGGENNVNDLKNVPTEKKNLTAKANLPIRKIAMERSCKWGNDPTAFTYEKDGKTLPSFRWVGCMYPTEALAQNAEMSLREYEDFVFGAVGATLDVEDAIKYWEDMSSKQSKICDYLDGKDKLHFKSKNCDLVMSLIDRKWINCDGRLNFPDGEVFSAPVEDSVNGWVNFTYPTLHGGRRINSISLQFKDGKCYSAKASNDEETDYLNKTLDTDEWCRNVGEIAIGTNEYIQQWTGHILYDEKIGGSFHMALGSGYPETGSKQTEAAIHWDMICDMKEDGEIYADGELFYEKGKFII